LVKKRRIFVDCSNLERELDPVGQLQEDEDRQKPPDDGGDQPVGQAAPEVGAKLFEPVDFRVLTATYVISSTRKIVEGIFVDLVHKANIRQPE
jgi:hypothetical protein